jgi:hypothetical protein
MNDRERYDTCAPEVRMTACGLGHKRIDLGGDPLGELALSARAGPGRRVRLTPAPARPTIM